MNVPLLARYTIFFSQISWCITVNTHTHIYTHMYTEHNTKTPGNWYEKDINLASDFFK